MTAINSAGSTQVAAVNSAATAFGGLTGTKTAATKFGWQGTFSTTGTNGFAAGYVVYLGTASAAMTVDYVEGLVSGTGTGAGYFVIGTGALSNVTFGTPISITAPTANGYKKWVAGTDWTGAITLAAGQHLLLYNPSGSWNPVYATQAGSTLGYWQGVPANGGTANISGGTGSAWCFAFTGNVTSATLPRASLTDKALIDNLEASQAGLAAAQTSLGTVVNKYGLQSSFLLAGGGAQPVGYTTSIGMAKADGVLNFVEIGVQAAGSFTLVIANKSGSDFFAVQRIPLTAPTASVLTKWTASDFGTVPIKAGQWLFFDLNGAMTYSSFSNAGDGFWQLGGSLTGWKTIPSFQTGFALGARFGVTEQGLLIDSYQDPMTVTRGGCLRRLDLIQDGKRTGVCHADRASHRLRRCRGTVRRS